MVSWSWRARGSLNRLASLQCPCCAKLRPEQGAFWLIEPALVGGVTTCNVIIHLHVSVIVTIIVVVTTVMASGTRSHRLTSIWAAQEVNFSVTHCALI